MVSDQIDNWTANVKKIPRLIKILGDGNEIMPLYDREVELLMGFGKKEHLVKMSYGYIENDNIIITYDPMKDYEGTIKKLTGIKERLL